MDKRLDAICGDAIEVMKTLPPESVDLIVTDPPYNLNKDYGNTKDNLEFADYLEFSRNWLKEADRLLKSNGTIYIFMGVRYISYIYSILEQEFHYTFNSWITWFYTQGIGKTKGFSPRHDDILMFTKSEKDFIFNLDSIRVPQKFYRSINNMRGANPGNVWEFSHMHYCNKNRKAHPTQKPEALYERMKRIPNDLNNEEYRNTYIQNHINWFLSNHPDTIQDFLDEANEKYSCNENKIELEPLLFAMNA